MTKYQIVTIPRFLESGFLPDPTVAERTINHLKKHQKVYIQLSGLAVTCLIVGAADPNIVHAATATQSIDTKAHHIYARLCMIGKWIIVIRGGIDIISSMSQGELDSMKKKIITYVVGYAALLGLPWILDQASLLFDGSST